jgi:anti-anti-sigma factor
VPGTIELGVDFAVDQAVVRVRGEIDLLTAPTLGAVLGLLVDQGYSELVLDLAELDFMDASGLRVMAGLTTRLATLNRTLTVRAAPLMTLRILEITGMDTVVRLESHDPSVAALGAEQSPGDHSLSVQPVTADLSADLARVSSGLSNTAIDAALRRVTVLADATIGGADGVSVTLQRHGQLTTVASSNDTVLRMDDHQYETGEGPCLAAATQGHWFHIESLEDERRWPAFVPRAIDEGIASILSTPLMAAERAVGALNIYSNTKRSFGAEQQELAAMFASQASGILLDAGADEQMGERIADALVAREVIALAQGMLMSEQRLTAEGASAELYRAARAARITVRGHAAEIVASAPTDNDVSG